jgi:hypothetical protein
MVPCKDIIRLCVLAKAKKITVFCRKIPRLFFVEKIDKGGFAGDG